MASAYGCLPCLMTAPPSSNTPQNTVSMMVSCNDMKSTNDNGLQKQGCLLRTLPVNMKKRVDVVSSEGGTSDGLFYVPDVASADSTAQRATPVQYAKINPNEHSNVVRRNHDFHISFIGMCITPQDFGKTNELLLCSISKRNHVFSKNMEKRVTEKKKERILEKEKKKESKMTGSEEVEVTDEILADETSITDATNEKGEKLKNSEANKFPLSLSMSENDIPFIHYDPIIDGHNTGTAANSFVTIPSTKRMYLQRNGTSPDVLLDRRIMVRFTVMEIDKLSEEQMEAIKSIEKISASVGSAAAAVPYLKFVSSVLKFATHFGKSALKRACNADHVMSKDVSFMLGEPQVEKGEDGEDDTKPAASEPYGNYLRYGYYYFLEKTIDAKLFAQTGSSSQAVPLLLKRQGYDVTTARPNEREFFPFTGVSYVVVKVAEGFSPHEDEDKVDLVEEQRARLLKLLQKYSG